MPSHAHAILPDAGSFLQSLAFGSEDLKAAKDAARNSREFRRGLEAALQRLPEGTRGVESLRRAAALYLLSRPEQALEELALAPDSPQTSLLRGKCALENGDPATAAAAFASLVGSNVDGPSLLLDLATSAALAGDSGMAQKAASRLPDGADSLYAEGIALESNGEYGEAKAKYEAAVKADPNHGHALFRLALRLDTEGQDERAAEIYRRCIALTPVHVNALMNVALLYEDQGRWPEAESCYRKILTVDANHVRARIGMKDVTASQTMFYDEDHERREDRRNQILRTPISEFELSVRSRNCLAKMNIETLGDLVKKSEQELLAYKNFGETSLQEIKDILAQKGLRLGMSGDDDKPLFTASKGEAEAELDALFGGGLLGDDTPEPPEGDEPKNVPIEALDLSIRARRCMDTLEIHTVGDLLARSESELLAAKNFGQTSLNEVRRKLDSLGLSLRKK